MAMVNSLWRDIHFGFRALLRDRSFSIVAILTLALGIGATTAILSIVSSVLLRALPFADSESLVFLVESVGSGVGLVSYPNYLDWREQNRVFGELAAYSASDWNVTVGGAAMRLSGEFVTDSYLPLLRIMPALGRNFSAAENRNPGVPPVAVISSALWTRQFAKSLQVLGQTIKVNEANFTIVGVAPPDFNGVNGHVDVWIPLGMRDLVFPQSAAFHFNEQRDIHWHRVIGRLKAGVSLDQARSKMRTIGSRLALAYPQANKERSVQVNSAAETYLGQLRSPLLLLLGAAGAVFFISAFNVANVFLIRAGSREHEIAVRSALGAARRRLVQQWIVEGVLIATTAGALGFILATASVGSIVTVLPVRLPAFSAVAVDRCVFLFTAFVSILTGALLGFIAGVRGSRRDSATALNEGARGFHGRAGFRLAGALVVAEIAVSVVVTIGAGLLLRSFEQLRRVNPGFEPDHLLLARLEIPSVKYGSEERRRVLPEIVQRVSSLPQMQSAALTTLDPFVSGGIKRGLTVEGHAALSASEQDEIFVQEISPAYFTTMKIPFRAGRDFSFRDTTDAPRVIIVSRAFGQRFWPGQSSIGKRIKYGPSTSSFPLMEIVGEVADVRAVSLRSDPNDSLIIYAPLLQSQSIVGASIVARTRTAPEAAAVSLRGEIRRIDSEIPLYGISTMDMRIAVETQGTRSFAILLASFAFLGVGLAAVGTYAAMAARVARRTREIGIRMALGADRSSVLRMVLRQGALLAFAGVVIGIAGGLWVTRYLAVQLYGVPPTDLLTFAASIVLLAGIVAGACWIPGRRAMSVDPIAALRR